MQLLNWGINMNGRVSHSICFNHSMYQPLREQHHASVCTKNHRRHRFGLGHRQSYLSTPRIPGRESLHGRR